MNQARPTEEDRDALDLLLKIDGMSEKDALFCESLYEHETRTWSIKQCAWFDGLCERYL